MVKSFFDPAWEDLGPLGTYGRWAGVNWVWSLNLTVYHAVISIAIPILLVELMFPALRDRPWLGKRGLWACAGLLLVDVLLGFFVLTPYRPPFLPYILALASVVGLWFLARRQPERWWKPSAGRVPRPRRFAVTGFGATLGFFLIFWLPPEWRTPVWLCVGATVGLVAGTFRLVAHRSRGGAWQDAHRLALAGGVLEFFIAIAPIQALSNATRPDNTTGMTWMGLGTLALLFWLWRRTRRRAAPVQPV